MKKNHHFVAKTLAFINFFKKKNNTKSSLSYGLLLAALSINSYAADLPTGGQITSGSGEINQAGQVMTVTQNTQNLVADWQSFSIGQGYAVNFVQPSASAVALNRVIGGDVSLIQGSLTANGQVFLINPNGILFTPTARVDVGGLTASTLNLSNENFLAGKYNFEGMSSNAVVNHGNIQVVNGGTVALIAAKVINDGNIIADGGNILMGGGSKVTLDLGGVVKLQVEEGLINTLIEQGGAIRADGGNILLTTKATGELTTSVINHSGISQARTLATGEKGQIVLLGDMKRGTTNVAGTLDASAPNGGDGGFIETSAAHVSIAAGTKINAGSAHGKGGSWLLDPYDYLIDSVAAANIVSSLNSGTDVTITTTSDDASLGSNGDSDFNGDITVASDIIKNAGGDATLTLQAANTIVINAMIKSTSGKLNILLDADNDDGSRDGGGVVIVNKDIYTNGGNLDFGTGATYSINGVETLVGGDLYVGGTDALTFDTGGGNINVQGQFLIANTEGLSIKTRNGNASFYDIINSGNKYDKISFEGDWTAARDDAKTGTGAEEGDTYLATVTSRLENSVVGYTANYETSWLGGQRVIGIGTDTVWRWTQGPEGLEDGGNGLQFFTQNNSAITEYTGGSPIDDRFSNWNGGEPNNCCENPLDGNISESIIQIVNAQGKWNDLPETGSDLSYYVRETNVSEAKLQVDAGTGTTYFAKDIGGLKGIDFTAYDAMNPNLNPDPEPNTDNPPVTVINDIPKDNAIANAQNQAANNSNQNSSSGNIFNSSPNGAIDLGLSKPIENQTIGSLQIVKIDSFGKNNASSDKKFEFKNLEKQFDVNGPTKVFVVDGGVRFPTNMLTKVSFKNED